MVHVLRLGSFLIFVALGVALPFVRTEGRRRGWTNVLLLYVLALNLFVVLAQTDAWPFSPYRMMAVDARPRGVLRGMIAFRAIDGRGREWDVEPLAWSPLFPQAVMGWFEVGFPRATLHEREEVGRFLLARVEDARRSRRAGARIGNERLLGPFAATDTNLSRPAPEVSPEPLVGLRVYRLTWVPETFVQDPGSVTRSLFFEYPASPRR